MEFYIADALANHHTADLPTSSPVNLIMDTDLGFGVDDVGAVAIANHLQDIGKVKVLGFIHDTGFHRGIGGIDTVN